MKPGRAPPRTQEQRSAETQSRLLEATIDCLVDLGYAGASTTEICARAGVSRGAQLHHYPTKAQLVAAAIERLFEQRHREFRETLARQPDVPSALSALWKIYTGKTFYAWAELLVASRADPELRAHLRRVDDVFFEQAKATCRTLLGGPSVDEERAAGLARLILSVLDGLALNHTLGGRQAVSRAVLAELAGILSSGAGR